MTPLVLVAHGSRDPRAAQCTRALARAVGAAGTPGRVVEPAFLGFTAPGLPAALAGLRGRGYRRAVAVPLLLTAAYHGRVDLPAELARAAADGTGPAVDLAGVLGPAADPGLDEPVLRLLVAGLGRRLGEVLPAGWAPDALVLAAAGSTDTTALRTVDRVAAALSAHCGVPCRAGYAGGAGPSVPAAVAALAGHGARRVAVASYFLAPGRLHDRVVAQAAGAGAGPVAPALAAAPEVVDAVLVRAASAVPVPTAVPAGRAA